jgi:hypothetical protein
MLMRKTWERTIMIDDVGVNKYRTLKYTGWFLFGIIPLYINRVVVKSF